MAWNEPGGNKPKDPWGGGGDQGPPDLDEALKNLKDKINNVFGSKGGKPGGGGSSSGGGSPWPVLIIALVIVSIGYGLMGFSRWISANAPWCCGSVSLIASWSRA